MLEHDSPPGHLIRAASVLETHVEEILEAYERRLEIMRSPLISSPEARAQLRAQALSVLREVASALRGESPFVNAFDADSLSQDIGISRAREGVHAIESLKAVIALSEAALLAVADDLPHSRTSAKVVAAIALVIQATIMERVTKASLSYGNFLLGKLHESHADERRRIGRELHDRVAHSIMVVFRSLELYEVYKDKEPPKAQTKLELAKKTAQDALDLTRRLSRELRISSAEEGLEVALSDLLRAIVPPNIGSWVSAKGDESLIAPEVRDELFLILREAIRNAVAHSGAESIKVETRTTESRFEASVEDDGHGFEAEKATALEESTGLSSMRERVTILGGTLDIASAFGKGTRIEICVPLPRGGSDEV